MRERALAAARQARRALLAGLDRAGTFERCANSGWRRRRLLILCYHGVALRDEHEWNGALFVTADFLRRRFELLRDEGCSVLPLGEAMSALRRGTLPPRSVAITFDDGLYDFCAAAAPLLEAFGFPATNYVSTYYCVNQRPTPIVALRYVLWCARGRTLAAGELPGQDDPVDLSERLPRERLAAKLFATQGVRQGGEEAQQAALADVATRLGVDLGSILEGRLFHLMSPDELSDVARRGFDMQLHTHRHRTPRDQALFAGEITENRRLLESMTGRPATHFCYPSGDVDPVFLPWLRALGVETATTTAIAGLADSGVEPLMLPRFVDTMAHSELEFRGWLSGVGSFLRLRRG